MSKRIRYKSGYKHVLVSACALQTDIRPPDNIVTGFISLWTDGALFIRAGYAWDGASGYPDKKTIMRGSLVHDALYQLIRNKHLDMSKRLDADKLLRTMCRDDGMPAWEAWCVYKAVRNFGKYCVHKPKQVRVAP